MSMNMNIADKALRCCGSPTCCVLSWWRGRVKAMPSGFSTKVEPAPVSLLPLRAAAPQAYCSKQPGPECAGAAITYLSAWDLA